MNKKALLEKRGSLVQELNTIESALNAEKRSMTDVEKARINEIDSELTKIDEEIQTLETLEKRKKPINLGFGGSASDGEEKELRKMANEFSISRATQAVSSGKRLDGVYAEFNEMAEEEMRMSGVAHSRSSDSILIPSHLLADIALRNASKRNKYKQKRAMTVTGGDPVGEQGGYNVQTDVMGIVEVLAPYMALGDLGIQTLSGLRGNLSWPKSSQGYTGGGWATENGTATEISPEFSELQLSPKRFAAWVDVSKQLLAQSNNSIDAFVTNLLLETLATQMEQKFIKGGGSNEPTGILSNTGITTLYAGAAANNSTNANGANLVFQDITNLIKTVMKSNARNAQFLTNYDVQAALQNTPRQASGVEGNTIIKEDFERLNGRQVAYTTNVPSNLTKGSASDLSAIICGDFSKMITGSWGGIEIARDTMTGLKAGKDTIVINSYVDMILSHAEAFAAIKDADTSI